MFGQLFRAKKQPPRPTPRKPTARLGLERLEAREVPATIHGVQYEEDAVAPQVATDSNGPLSVVAWTDMTSAFATNVYARLVQSNGVPVTGVITVATNLPSSTTSPVKVDAAIDPSGRFAVVYDHLINPQGLPDVGLQRYDAAGRPVGTTWTIGTSNRVEKNPVIDLSATGRPVVAFDQATANDLTHRLNSVLFAAFDNLQSSTQTSISSVGGEIFPTVAFNAEGQFLLGGTTLSGQARTPLRVFSATGSLSASTVVTSPQLVVPALSGVPGSDEWRLAYLDEVNGIDTLVVRSVKPGANTATAPVIGASKALVSGNLLLERPSLAAYGNGSVVVAYWRPKGNQQAELVVGKFATNGASRGTDVLLTGVLAPTPFDLGGAGRTFSALAIFTRQLSFTQEIGDLVPFALNTQGIPTGMKFSQTMGSFTTRSPGQVTVQLLDAYGRAVTYAGMTVMLQLYNFNGAAAAFNSGAILVGKTDSLGRVTFGNLVVPVSGKYRLKASTLLNELPAVFWDVPSLVARGPKLGYRP